MMSPDATGTALARMHALLLPMLSHDCSHTLKKQHLINLHHMQHCFCTSIIARIASSTLHCAHRRREAGKWPCWDCQGPKITLMLHLLLAASRGACCSLGARRAPAAMSGM